MVLPGVDDMFDVLKISDKSIDKYLKDMCEYLSDKFQLRIQINELWRHDYGFLNLLNE